jgi:integrase/recombinase XerD
MIEDMHVQNLSVRTQDSYIQHISLFARHFYKSPELLGPEQIRAYQIYLTNERKLAASTICIAIFGTPFSVQDHLEKELVRGRGDSRSEETSETACDPEPGRSS